VDKAKAIQAMEERKKRRREESDLDPKTAPTTGGMNMNDLNKIRRRFKQRKVVTDDPEFVSKTGMPAKVVARHHSSKVQSVLNNILT
jgi:hypothetical protein